MDNLLDNKKTTITNLMAIARNRVVWHNFRRELKPQRVVELPEEDYLPCGFERFSSPVCRGSLWSCFIFLLIK